MMRVATIVPAESDLLCEGCGYTLNGLPETGRCPECGKPITQSVGTHRVLPPWEGWPAGARSLIATTRHVILHPTRFYRTLMTRPEEDRSINFARIHWWIAAAAFAIAAYAHLVWYLEIRQSYNLMQAQIITLALPLLIVATYVLLAATTGLAARLTHWEATYRGMRLPLNIVRRGLHFHAAHYLPVAAIAFISVIGYSALVNAELLGPNSAVTYLYVLSAEVILSAAYLFQTYWIGMKNMMFANR